MRLDILGTARLILLGLSLACGVRAQEPVRPEPPATQTRAAAEAGPTPPPRTREDRSVARKSAPPSQVNLETSAIRGSQELPKVLYIVPWKDPAMAELAGRPVNSLVGEVLAPVDREVFRRQTRYFGQLYGVEKPVGGASPD